MAKKKRRKIDSTPISETRWPDVDLGLSAQTVASGHVAIYVGVDNRKFFDANEVERIAQAAEDWAKSLRDLARRGQDQIESRKNMILG